MFFFSPSSSSFSFKLGFRVEEVLEHGEEVEVSGGVVSWEVVSVGPAEESRYFEGVPEEIGDFLGNLSLIDEADALGHGLG